MPRRSFIAELDAKMKTDAVTSHLKPPDPTRLIRDSGYIQGLKDAIDLYDNVTKANLLEEDKRD